jgi:hypothetical protein
VDQIVLLPPLYQFKNIIIIKEAPQKGSHFGFSLLFYENTNLWDVIARFRDVLFPTKAKE